MKTFAIAGCGHLGKIVREAYGKGLLDGYRLVAAFSKESADTEALVKGTEAKACTSMDEVISFKPDYIVETASIALLKDFAVKALDAGISVIPLSIGAFADAAFKEAAISRLPEAYESGRGISEAFSTLYQVGYRMIQKGYKVGIVVDNEYYIWMGQNYYIRKINY